MTMFDAEFLTNVSIPDYAGLGKGVSVGYGMAVRKKDKKEQ
jgi:transketolase N-terminal domain/subunit